MLSRFPLTPRSILALGSVASSVVLISACSRNRDEAPPVPGPAAEAPVAAAPASEEPEPEPAQESGAKEVEPEPAEPEPPAAPPPADSLTFKFVGDVIFGRYRASGFDAIPEDGYAVFDDIQPALEADVLVANLETPLVRDLPMQSPIGSKFRFGASMEHAKQLVDAGFTAVSLANNHWYDMRLEGVEQTPLILEELGIVPLGAATREAEVFRVQTIEESGWKIGFMALTNRSNAPQREDVPTLPFLSAHAIPETVSPVLEAARDAHDMLIVQIHWGEEYEDGPSFAQVKAAHSMIDAGADMVIGHHPHVLQGVEIYNEGVIAYSLGNFVFENTNDPPRLTGVLEVVAKRDSCERAIRFHPAYIKRMPHQHPYPARGYMGRLVRARVDLVNRRFKSKWRDDEGTLVLENETCAAKPAEP